MSTEGGMRAVLAAGIANLGIAASKFVAFLLTGSSSMLSEAIHSLADTANQGLLLIGNKRSQRAADSEHQFGYGRARYVYGFLVAIVLFLMGGLFSLYEGFHKFHHPEELERAWIAFAVLFIAIALESWSWRTAMKEVNKSRGTFSLSKYVRRTRQPELPVVLLEDTGALIGLGFALVGVSMATITGDGRWDGLGAMAVGVLLVIIAVFLAYEMASMLVGESALPEQEEAIRAAVAGTPGISRIINMRTVHTGPDELLVAIKIGIRDAESPQDLVDAINEAERRVRAQLPTARYVYIEPDVYQEGYQSPHQRPAGTDGEH